MHDKRTALTQTIEAHEAAVASHEACVYTLDQAQGMLEDLKSQRSAYAHIEAQLSAEHVGAIRDAIGGAALKFQPSAELLDAIAARDDLEEQINVTTKAVSTLKADVDHAAVKVARLADLRELAAEDVLSSELDERSEAFLKTLAELQTEYRKIIAFANCRVKDPATAADRHGGMFRTLKISKSTREAINHSGVIAGQGMFVTQAYENKFATDAFAAWDTLRKDPTTVLI